LKIALFEQPPPGKETMAPLSHHPQGPAVADSEMEGQWSGPVVQCCHPFPTNRPSIVPYSPEPGRSSPWIPHLTASVAHGWGFVTWADVVDWLWFVVWGNHLSETLGRRWGVSQGPLILSPHLGSCLQNPNSNHGLAFPIHKLYCSPVFLAVT
jgi:hypothetical protein